MNIRTFPPLFPVLLLSAMLFSCNPSESEQASDSTPPPVSSVQTQDTVNVTWTTFQNTDSAGNPLGFGYDVTVNGKRMIHQTTIPGEPGVKGFASLADAEKVAQLVSEKLRGGNGFPTVSRTELDSLNITINN